MDQDTTSGGARISPRDRRTGSTIPAPATTRSARLVCVAGADLGRVFPLGPEPLVLGRGSAAQAGLRAPDVSRRHVRVTSDRGGYLVEDLESANGTLLNGAPVTSAVAITIGDRLQLGETTILVLTYRDELETKMRELQKLEAMNQAVAGLAHDFRNALMVILAGLDHAATLRLDAVPELAEVIADVRNAAENASALAGRLVHFRDGEALAHDQVGLAALVDDTLAMARRVTPASIAFESNVDGSIELRGSRDELQQVLLNLFLNARDAMPSGGTLRVLGRRAYVTRVEAVSQHMSEGGDFVELEITDTGAGMTEATAARAFEPFFTTKAPGQGTGLGLSMVRNIVRRYGGAVEIESSPGRGTTFRIWLPHVRG